MDHPSDDTRGLEPPAVAEPTLLTLLGTIAHRASDTQLVVTCAVAVLGASSILLFAPTWWRIALPLVSVAAFAGWAIAEHDGSHRPAVNALKLAAATVGIMSAFAFGLTLLMGALGTWIS